MFEHQKDFYLALSPAGQQAWHLARCLAGLASRSSSPCWRARQIRPGCPELFRNRWTGLSCRGSGARDDGSRLLWCRSSRRDPRRTSKRLEKKKKERSMQSLSKVWKSEQSLSKVWTAKSEQQSLNSKVWTAKSEQQSGKLNVDKQFFLNWIEI